MRVDLIGSDGKTYSNDNLFLLTRSTTFQSSRYLKKGRYYYEITHISGAEDHITGFKANDDFYVGFFPHNKYPSAMIFYNDNIYVKDWAKYQDLNLSDIGEKHTFGVGIDTISNKFFIRVNHEIRIIDMTINTKVRYWRAFMCEATTTPGTSDNISVNFGETPFKYQIPPGFVSLTNEFPKNTCNMNRKLTGSFVSLVLLLHLK